jgi:P-type Cu+ transporter
MLELNQKPTSPQAHELSLPIEGMTCASCVFRIEKSISQLSGVKSVQVNLASEKAIVQVDSPERLSDVIGAIESAGYSVAQKNTQKTEDSKNFVISKDLVFLALSALLTLPLVIPMILELFGVHLMLPATVQLLLATPVQFIFGARFYVAAFKALKARSANMDLLVALGTTAAFGLSLYEVLKLTTGAHLYFESSAL